MNRSDQELMRGIAADDHDALIHLYHQHAPAVYSLAWYILRDHHSAEEITQDVFVAIWQKAHQFDAARGRLEPWLLQIARNLSIDCLRRQRRRAQESASLDSAAVPLTVSNAPQADDYRRDLHKLLQTLPDEQRQAIELSYFHGYTHAEIAAQLKLPLGTVKSRILLGLRKLQSLMK